MPARCAWLARLAGVDGVERAHQAHAGEELGGGGAGALLAGLDRHVAVARRVGVAGVEDDLAGEDVLQVLADLRHRAVGDRDEDDVAEGRRLARRAHAGLGAELVGEGLQLIGVARRDEHLVAGLHPELGEGAADVAGADDADLERLGGLRRRRRRADGREGDEDGGGEETDTMEAHG